MRSLLSLLLISVAGCSGMEHLSAQPSEATAQVQRWVPLTTSTLEAQTLMERHGFTCSLIKNGSFANLRGIDYIYCDKSEGDIVKRRWQVALVLTSGKVSAVQVTAGLIGP